MAKADFKQLHILLFGSFIIFLSFVLNGFTFAEADSTTVVHAPCNDTSSTLGLRTCSTYIPQLLKQISNNQSAAYPIPMPNPSSTPGPNQPGMMQMYASAYYQGTDLDVSPSPSPALPGHMYPGNNFGPICELVPSNLNHNVAETVTQAAINNPSSPSCGTPMKISASYANCSQATDDETALMSSLNVTPAQLDNMSPEEAQALLALHSMRAEKMFRVNSTGKMVVSSEAIFAEHFFRRSPTTPIKRSTSFNANTLSMSSEQVAKNSRTPSQG
jgi:hypothetical protein